MITQPVFWSVAQILLDFTLALKGNQRNQRVPVASVFSFWPINPHFSWASQL